MEIETTLVNINGSWYVRIPANFVEFLKIKEITQKHLGDKDKVKIKDAGMHKVMVTFPVW